MAERDPRMDELEVAEAMERGDLPSPQRYGSFFLFAIRITGTGLSYRLGRDEFVWRDKSLYLNDRFLKRCQGLPVIWDHPKDKPAIDSEEFNSRIVGTTFLPFIRENDVWAIVKIYDVMTVDALLDEQLSTSPAVVFRESTSTNETVKLDDGSTLLVEGTPALLDHIAICDAGVWDKGGPPTGVDSTGALMAENEEKESVAADKRHDSALERMDAMLDAMKGMHDRFDSSMGRMDAFEKDLKAEKDARRHDSARRDKFGHRKDGESYKDYSKRHDDDEAMMADALRKDSEKKEEDCMADAKGARHDAEEDEKRHDKDFDKWAKEEEKEPEHKEDSKKDAARKDESEDEKKLKETEKEEKQEERGDSRKDSALARENAEMRLRLAALEGTMKKFSRETSAADQDALASTQSRADSVAAMFGDRAPPPVAGEEPIAYRRRMLGRFQRHSPRFKDTRFDSYDANTMGLVEDQVYADAVSSARTTTEVRGGVLIPYVEKGYGGREITRFHGDIGAFMEPFVPQQAQIVKLNRPQKGMM